MKIKARFTTTPGLIFYRKAGQANSTKPFMVRAI
jgi:hypothetical protein